MDVYYCAYLAGNNYFEVLKWARENGCPWNADTCSSAASGGHLEILKWARENGCPWNKDTERAKLLLTLSAQVLLA